MAEEDGARGDTLFFSRAAGLGEEEKHDEESSDHPGEEEMSVLRRQSWPVASYNILAVMFGAIQMPYSMGQMGWTFGLGFVVLSSVSTWASGRMLGEATLATGASSYPELGRKAFGKVGLRLIVLAQWLSYFLTGVTQIAYSGAQYQQTLRGTRVGRICTEGWMTITALVLAPCVMVPSFGESAVLSLIVISSQALGLGVMYYQIAKEGRYDSDALCYDKITTTSILATASNTAFAYGGHGVLPEVIREMREPNKFNTAFDYAYAFVCPVYVLTACLGYWAFGNAASANFTENLRATPALRAYLWINSLSVFPTIVINQVGLFLNVELAFDVLPTDVWTNSTLRPRGGDEPLPRRDREGNPRRLPDNPPDAGPGLPPDGEFRDGTKHLLAASLLPRVAAADDDEFYERRRPSDDPWIARFPPVLVRAVFRLAYLYAMYTVAYALIGAGLGDFTDLAGALGIACLTYWAPFILHTKIFWQRTTRLGLLWALLNVAFGLFVSVVGTYYSLKSLTKDSVTIFQESSCQEGAFFFGNHLWDLDQANGHAYPNSTSAAYKYVIDGCCNKGHTCGQ